MAGTNPEVPQGMDAFDPRQMQQMQAMLSMAGGNFGMMPPAGVPPQIDPAMAQAYMQMFQYLQQGLTQQGLAGGAMGMPPMPLPGMPPYAPTMPIEPAINVSVEGMRFQYQLTEDDLLKVFSRYGSVKSIRVDEAGASAVIHFNQFQEAQAAMNDLDGKILNGLEGKLKITWYRNSATPPPYPSVPFPGWGVPPGPMPAAWPPAPTGTSVEGTSGAAPGAAGGGTPAGGGAERSPPHTRGARKYTCRFLIGIENDKDFQVARRIIGSKGANMKRIVKQTEAKLRLRGMGSGYFEGPNKKESLEPLQLCVSCTSYDGYKTAVKQVESLLLDVYEEYKTFCSNAGKPVPHLQINLSENQLVYSESKTNTSADSTGGAADGAGSPKKDARRGRRSRGKRDPRTASGEVDRGEPGPNAPPVEEIEKWIDVRNEARRANNFAEADRVRELLHSKGVALMDEPGGRGRGTEVTTWRYWRD